MHTALMRDYPGQKLVDYLSKSGPVVFLDDDDGFSCLGVDEVGFDYGSLLQTAGVLASGAASSIEEKQAGEKAQSEAEGKLNKAIAADLAATNMAAQADVSAQLHSKSAQSDKTKAVAAANQADQAGADLSSEQTQARIDAANNSLALAQKLAKASPKDGYKAAVVKAWTATVEKLHNPPSGGGKKDSDQEGWLTRRVIGPIPGYGVLVIIAVAGIVVKKIFF